MKEKRRIKRITTYAAVLLLIVQLAAASVCCAEDLTYKALREETMFIAVPGSWQVEEFGSLDEDEEAILEDETVQKILELQDQEDAKQGELWICAEPYDDSYYYCNTPENTEDYLDAAGDDAIEAVMDEAFAGADSWTRDGTKYLKGEQEYTYVIRQDAKVDGEKYLIYLNCEFTPYGGIHEVLLFEEPFDQDVCDRIGESLQAYSYASELIDNRINGEGGGDPGGGDSGGNGGGGSSGFPENYFNDDPEDSIDVDDIFSGLVAVFILIVMGGIVRAGARGKLKRSRNPLRRRDTAGPDSTAGVRPDAQNVRRAIDKWTLKEFRKGKCDHEDMHIQSGTKYTGYQESLRTLHRSGLLTTKEMNELLEKHKDEL